jgi:3-hydroxyacyl-CoA dehydrogenase
MDTLERGAAQFTTTIIEGTPGMNGIENVVVVGAGLVGTGWAIVFARAGKSVVLHDVEQARLDNAREKIHADLVALADIGLLSEAVSAIAARIDYQENLAHALANAEYVQECIVETLSAKQAIFSELDALAADSAILASSTSGFTTSSFADGVPGRHRCLVAHPVNPPHVVPFVEISGADFTAADVVERTRLLMLEVGQEAIVLRREIHGFVLNRLQWSLLGEAYRLVEQGVATVDEIDCAIRHGLGRRWAFMGPFEVGDLNAPDGLQDYLQRFGETIEKINATESLTLKHESNAAMHAARRELLDDDERESRMRWRDRRLMALAKHLQEQGDDSNA